MFSKHFKDSFKVILNQLSPDLYLKFLKSRYSITNNMNIYIMDGYDSAGTFATMWDTPPKTYEKWVGEQTFNEEGVPLHAPDGSNLTSTVPIAQYGLCEYAYYIHTKGQKHLENAKRTAEWLVKHQGCNGGWYYEYDFLHPCSGTTIKAPWICAMGQGEGVGFLARMYHLTGNEEYKVIAENALIPLELPVERGGTRRVWHGCVFFEEYPTPVPSFTINGFMFCLIGVYDFYKLCGSNKAKILFDEGYSSLIKMLPYYDSENTTYYDLSHITCPPRKPQCAGKYDPLHVMLVQTLNIIKPNPVLRFYVEKWSWGLIKAKDLPSGGEQN